MFPARENGALYSTILLMPLLYIIFKELDMKVTFMSSHIRIRDAE